VNFLSCIFSKEFLGPAYRQLLDIKHFNGGAILSERTKAILAVKIVDDDGPVMIKEELDSILNFLLRM